MVSELRLSYPHWLLVMNCLGFYVVGSNWRLTLFKEKLMICTIINLTGMYKSQSGISIQKKAHWKVEATCSAFRLYIFWQYVCSLGIEPTTFALLMRCSNQ